MGRTGVRLAVGFGLAGTRLGVSYGNRAFVLSASGRKLARTPSAQRRGRPGDADQPGWPPGRDDRDRRREHPAPAPLRPLPLPGGADGSGRDTVARSTAATAWLGDRLLRDEAADSSPFVQQICLLASNDDFPCERLVASDPEHDLWDPAVSPDRRLLAVTRAPVDSTQGEIALYSTATAQLVRVLTDGTGRLPSRAGRPTAARSCSRAATAVSGWCAPPARRARSDGSSVREFSPSGSGDQGSAPRLTAPKRVLAGARVPDPPDGARHAARARACSAAPAAAGGRWPLAPPAAPPPCSRSASPSRDA